MLPELMELAERGLAVIPLYREDGVTPIANCGLDARRKGETRDTVRALLSAMLLGEPTVTLDPFGKRDMLFFASMKQSGWHIRFVAKRRKMKFEIADFEAREKALAEYVDKHVTVEFSDDETEDEAAA